MRHTRLELPELNGDEEHTGMQLSCEFYPDGAGMIVTRLGENNGFVMIHLTPSQVQALGQACRSQKEGQKSLKEYLAE